ncbi:Neuropeptide CCHamide-1 receptor [Armadillidium vulgare]|nr:Neuropeptide CCHamide-1 receptor [Armadillidium vulgare]
MKEGRKEGNMESKVSSFFTYLIYRHFLFCLISGNGTLVIIFFKNRNLRSAPNTYILSLAIGDLCVLCLSLPFVSTIYVIDSWPFGLFMCRFSEFFRNVSVGVTVFTLTALSGDRYLAIVSPFKRVHNNGQTTIIVTISIWILAIILSLPDALFSILLDVLVGPDKIVYICYPFPDWLPPWYRKANILGKALVFYLIPLLIIATFYLMMARSLLAASKNVLGELQGVQKQLKTRKNVAKIVLCFI